MIGKIAVMCQRGDDKITWDTNDLQSIAKAKKKFDDLIAKGYKAFSTDSNGSKGNQVTEFNWTLREIIMVPQMKGG